MEQWSPYTHLLDRSLANQGLSISPIMTVVSIEPSDGEDMDMVHNGPDAVVQTPSTPLPVAEPKIMGKVLRDLARKEVHEPLIGAGQLVEIVELEVSGMSTKQVDLITPFPLFHDSNRLLFTLGSWLIKKGDGDLARVPFKILRDSR